MSKRQREKLANASYKLSNVKKSAKRAYMPTTTVSRIHRNPNSVAAETHYLDVISAVTTPTPFITAGTFVCLNATKEGNASFERNGRRIVMKSLHLNGIITPNASAPGSTVSKYGRIMVIYDKQANGAAPALADVLLSESAGSSETNVYSGLRMANRGRFEIIIDERIVFPPITASAGAISSALCLTGEEAKISRFSRLKDRVTEYNGSNASPSVAEITTGSLYLLVLGETATTADYNFKWNSRLKFLP